MFNMTEGCKIHRQMGGEDSSWLTFKDEAKLGIHGSSSSSGCTSSIGDESMDGSSSDTADDASSSSPSSSNSYDLSEIMAQLPLKRGLSKFYQGKSESFTSLSRVTSTEDLAKKTSPYRRNYSHNNLKASKSCGTGLNSYKPYTLPRAVITKKSTRVSSFSSFGNKIRGSFLISSKPPMVPLHSNLGC